MYSNNISNPISIFELKIMIEDLKKDLRRLKQNGINPKTFAGGYHVRFVKQVKRLLKAQPQACKV
ncbi:MAG: hypothetical protein ACTSVI_10510 [Promethearchaeota archaeon]